MKKFILLLIILYNITINNIYASDEACFNTHPEINEYIDSMREVINSIEGKDFSSEELGGDSISQFGQGFSDVSRQLLRGTYMSAIVMKNITLDAVGGQSFTNLKMIFNSGVAIRDWKLLLYLERDLSDKAPKIGYAGILGEKIKKDEYEQYQEILEEIYIIDKISGWDQNITYSDLLQFIWKFNTFYKEIYLDAVGHNKPDFSLEEMANKLFRTTKLKVAEINNDEYQEFKEYYRLAVGSDNICEDNYSEKFLENIQKITGNSAFDGGSALDKFSESWLLLQEVLNDVRSSGELSREYEERKEKLLKRHYGTTLANDLMSYEGTWGVGMTRDTIKNEVLDPLVSFVDKLEYVSKTTEATDEVTKEQVEESLQNKQSRAVAKEAFSAEMTNTFDTILSMQQEQFVESTLQDPRPITHEIPFLSKRVYEGVKVLGDRGNADTIIYNLGNACQYQCVNHGNPYSDCWYDNK
ncbi:hypothetical protein [Candidatus Vampirococcus lugosii]|uniref:Uncharacterized protein n=1 Tax=Candidatus Vampirococcus lugosii TaxID=2789015 RepID=A0ABS5QKD9_9BACT|nr:hypothetical protein [Candidatus Vampirococcus lugosii]MBS8121700.1 hypothetical protein [Candidatus Vampirococcus lugosii]